MANVTIEISYGDGRRELRHLADGRYQVGREQGDIVLGDPQVSGRHGELLVVGGRLTYMDQG